MVSKQSEEYVEYCIRKWLKENKYTTLRSPSVFIDVIGEYLEHKPDVFSIRDKKYFCIECKGLRGKDKFSNRLLYCMVGQAIYYKEFLKCHVYLAIPFHGCEAELPSNIKGLLKILNELDIGLIVTSEKNVDIMLNPRDFII